MPHAGEYLGGGERDRTDDLMLAKHALSQLSYTPISGIRARGSEIFAALRAVILV